MANKVTIDVEARFIDNVSGEAGAASDAFKKVETNAKAAAKEVDNLGKKNTAPKLDANTDKFKKALDSSDKQLQKFGKTRAEAKLAADDKATSTVNKVLNRLKNFGRKTWSAILTAKDMATSGISKALNAARRFAGKTYSASVKVRDSGALGTLRKISSTGEKIAGKTWKVAVKVKDLATAPLRGIKNLLFSMKSLVLAITAGVAAKQLVLNPLNVADQYSSAKIGFSTLMGESGAQQMMDDLDAFAKKTPFNTTNVIESAQKMMAMGWDSDNLIGDLEVLGNAAAATGKLDQGLESIVRAMSQIKTKGRLSTEELNQLAEAGISAKAMLAEQLGYGTGDAGIAKMTKDLEDGAIASDQAIAALMAGMQKYNGMMDSIANETASGLGAQIKDAFEINVVRKWGQGLQDGAKRGLGTVVELLDKAEGSLSKFGDMMYDIGEKASNWVADKFQGAMDKILEITDSYEFDSASLGEKVSMLWKGVVADPLKEWFRNLWTDEENIDKATEFGRSFAENLTKGILAVLGITDIFEETGDGAESKGSNIAQGFAKGFVEGFDVSAITDKLVQAIGNVWNALPTWAKILIGGYAVGKAAGGIANFAGGVASFIGGVGSVIGSSGTVGAGGAVTGASGILGIIGKTGGFSGGGSGILGGLANLGYGAVGKISGIGAAGLSGGMAAGAGMGLITAGAGALYAGNQLFGAVESMAEGDRRGAGAKFARGTGTAVGIGVGAAAGAKIGATVGTLGGPIGTAAGALIGAGLGTVVGWFAGDKIAKNIEAAKYESEEMQELIKSGEASAEELANQFAEDKWKNAKNHFGDIALSMDEISRLSQQLVWGDDLASFDKFTAAAKTAQASMEALNSAGQQTDRWMWKAGLGVKFNEDEVESIKASFDDYINSAKSYVENKHYEFSASAELLLNLESEEGKDILESGNAYYAQIQEQLNTLDTELTNTLNASLENGVISSDETLEIMLNGEAEVLNEQEAIEKIQQEIANITKEIADAESDAELTLIDLKFGAGKMDKDSFDNFMAATEANLNERMSATDAAVTAQIANLNLRFPTDADKQTQEYKDQLQTILDSYTVEVDSIRADILGFELDIIGDAYAQELGEDAAADLQNVLEHCINENMDPIELDSAKLFELLGTGELPEETAANIQEMLQGVYDQLELVEVDGELLLNLGVSTEGDLTEEVKSTVDSQVPTAVDESVVVQITPEKLVNAMETVMPEDFNVPEVVNDSVVLQLNAAKTVQQQVDILASEFGINESEATSILWELSGEKSIMNTITVTPADFGLPSSINHSMTINITGSSRFSSGGGKGKGFRGGIFGGTGAMGSFARGGIIGDNVPGFSNGGIVRGGSQLIEVAEEGSPEMVIPLSSQRRGRGLKLWAQAGNMMGVPGFARGGIIGGDGSSDEGIRFNTIGDNDSAGSQSTQVEVGGITVQINVTTSDSGNIAEAIRAQASEITDVVAGIMADALGGQFENTPVRGGAA